MSLPLWRTSMDSSSQQATTPSSMLCELYGHVRSNLQLSAAYRWHTVPNTWLHLPLLQIYTSRC